MYSEIWDESKSNLDCEEFLGPWRSKRETFIRNRYRQSQSCNYNNHLPPINKFEQKAFKKLFNSQVQQYQDNCNSRYKKLCHLPRQIKLEEIIYKLQQIRKYK